MQLQPQQIELLKCMRHPVSAESMAIQFQVPAAQMIKQVKDLSDRKLLNKVGSGFPARYQITNAAKAKYIPDVEAVKQMTAEQAAKDRAAQQQQHKADMIRARQENRANVLAYLVAIPGQYETSTNISWNMDLDVRAIDAILFSLEEEGLVAHISQEGRHWCAILAPSADEVAPPTPSTTTTTQKPAATPTVIAPTVALAAHTTPVIRAPAQKSSPPPPPPQQPQQVQPQQPEPVVAAAVAPTTTTPHKVPLSTERLVDRSVILADMRAYFARAPVGITLFHRASELQEMQGVYYHTNELRIVIENLVNEGFLRSSNDGGYCRV
jgi:hypothetical protein